MLENIVGNATLLPLKMTVTKVSIALRARRSLSLRTKSQEIFVQQVVTAPEAQLPLSHA